MFIFSLGSPIVSCGAMCHSKKSRGKSTARQWVLREIAFLSLSNHCKICQEDLLFCRVSFWCWATDFSNESATFALKTSARAAFIFSATSGLRKPSPKRFSTLLYRANRSIFAKGHVKKISFFSNPWQHPAFHLFESDFLNHWSDLSDS